MNLKTKILELKSQGISQKEIAHKLNCSEGTVSYHCNPSVKEKALSRKKMTTTLSRRQKLAKKRKFYKDKELILPAKEVNWKHAEVMCAARLTELGWEVFVPLNHGTESDFIIHKNGVIKRCQVKSHSKDNIECMYIQLRRMTNHTSNTSTSPYTQIDWFLIYDGYHVYKVDNSETADLSVSLRYLAPKNYGGSGTIRMASDYIL